MNGNRVEANVDTQECEHYFTRRRDGRRCVYCDYTEFGPTLPIKDDHGIRKQNETPD